MQAAAAAEFGWRGPFQRRVAAVLVEVLSSSLDLGARIVQ